MVVYMDDFGAGEGRGGVFGRISSPHIPTLNQAVVTVQSKCQNSQ